MRRAHFLMMTSVWVGLLCLVTSQAAAQEVIRRWTEGPSMTVTPTVGNRVLFGAGSGLKWADITDPSNPNILSNGAEVAGTVRALAVGEGNRLLIAVGYAGLMGGTASGLSTVLPALDTPGYAFDVVLDGTVAYVADGVGGLRVVDAAFVTLLFELGSVDVGGEARSVVVVGNTAYVAAGAAGLVTVDVSVASNPTVLGSESTFGFATDVQVAGSVAYVADSQLGLVVFDVSSPAAPVWVAQHNSFNGRAVIVDGDRLFLADGAAGVAVFDLTSPLAPTWLGNYRIPGAQEFALLGDWLLVASSAAGLVVIDRDGSPNISHLGSWMAPGGSQEGVAVLEYSPPFAVLGANWVTGVVDGWDFHVVNVSDPAAPTLARVFGDSGPDEDPRRITSLEVIPPYFYMTDDWNGFQVWDALSAAAPSLVGTCTGCTGWFEDLESDGGDLYGVKDSAENLQALDLTTPTSPTVDGELGLPDSGRDLDVAGSRGLVANDREGLKEIDLTATPDPSAVGSLALQGEARSVHSVGDLAMVAARHGGLRSVDVATAGTPTAIGGYRPTSDSPLTHVVAGPAATRSGGGNWAMVAGQGIWFTDITTPSHPKTLAYAPQRSEAFQFSGSTAYIGHSVRTGLFESSAALQTIDLANLETSMSLGDIAAGGRVRAMATAGSTAFIAAGDGGLEIANPIFNTIEPPLLSSFDTGGRANDVERVGDLALVADGARGLVIVDVSDPTAPAEVGTFFDLEGEAVLLASDGDRAYVVCQVVNVVTSEREWNLTVIDITTPAAPSFLGRMTGLGTPQDVDVALGHVWLAVETEGLRVIDVGVPTAPTEVADVPFSRTRGVTIEGDLAFVAAGFAGLSILDVSTPASPGAVAVFDTPGHASDVELHDSIAYVTDGLNGLHLVDVSSPASPSDAGSVAIVELAEEVAIGLGQVFVSSAEAGMTTVGMPGYMFADGFETGNLDAWTLALP